MRAVLRIIQAVIKPVIFILNIVRLILNLIPGGAKVCAG